MQYKKGKKYRRRWKPKQFLIILMICIFIITTFSFLEFKIRPSAIKICMHQGEYEATRIINKNVYDILDTENTDYDNFVNMIYNDKGEIISLETKATNINRLQTEIANGVGEALQAQSNTSIDVPIGTASGIYLFSGKGPKLKLKLIPIENVKTELKSEFISAGLNQTCHRISIVVTASISTVIPFHSDKTQVSATYLIAETVIVGKTPSNLLTLPQS